MNAKSERGIYEAKITEDMVVKEIMARLSYARIKVRRIVERIPWGKTTSTAGIPDLVGYIPSTFKWANGQTRPPLPFYIECKKPGGGIRRPAQQRFIDEATADGVIAFFAQSWEDVVYEMAKHGIEVPQ